MGNEELSSEFRDKLAAELNDLETKINATIESYKRCLQRYSDSIENSFDGTNTINDIDLWNWHRDVRNEATNLVRISIKFKLIRNLKKRLTSLICLNFMEIIQNSSLDTNKSLSRYFVAKKYFPNYFEDVY